MRHSREWESAVAKLCMELIVTTAEDDGVSIMVMVDMIAAMLLCALADGDEDVLEQLAQRHKEHILLYKTVVEDAKKEADG